MIEEMFEGLALKMIRSYFGDYLFGPNKQDVRWKNGDLEVTNVVLKPEGLNALQLPLKVKAAYLGSVKIEFPGRIYKYPVVISVDRLYVVAEPHAQAVNLNRLILPSVTGSGSLKKTVIGNVKLSISNIDIRYEDESPGHLLAAGVTAKKTFSCDGG